MFVLICLVFIALGAADDTIVVKIGRVLYTSEHLNIVCVNANGLRTRRKRALLGKLLFDLQAGVAVVTETHLRRGDIGGLHFRNYNKPSHFCRTTEEGRRIGGGVLILVHNRFSTGKLPELEGLDPLIEHCSCKLYPSDGDQSVGSLYSSLGSGRSRHADV